MKYIALQKSINNFREKTDFIFNYLIILYAFVMPIQIGKAEGLVKILMILWILTLDYKELIKKIKNSTLLQTILIFTVLIFTSYLWSTHQTTEPVHYNYSHIYDYAHRFMLFFLFPIIIIVTKLRKDFLIIAISSFLLSMFINEIISYGMSFELWTTGHGSAYDPIAFHKNHITYSAFLGFSVLLSIYNFHHIQNKLVKSFYLIFIVTMTINLFMSAGRTGQFSLLITSIILTFIYVKNKKMILVTLFTIFTIFTLAYLNVATFHKRVDQMKQNVDYIIESKDPDTSFGTRIMNFATIPYLIHKDNFLFGVGIGDKPYYISTQLKQNFPYRLHNFDRYGFLHNSHIEMLVSNGIIGLFIYLFIFYLLFSIHIKDKLIKYVAYTLGIYFLCIGLTTDIFFFKAIMSLFGFFIGIIITQNLAEKDELLLKNKNAF